MEEKVGISVGYEEVSGPKITVVGIGGAGCNSMNLLAEKQVEGVRLVAINTDMYSLASSLAHVKLQIGENMTKGGGTGGDPEKGREAARKDSDKIAAAIEGTDVLFIATGLGGGTGTGASPVVAEIAKETGILTIAFAIMPFDFEGPETIKKAQEGLEELRSKVDAIMVALNSNIKNGDVTRSPKEAFGEIDTILYESVIALRDVIVKPSDMRLDLSDIKARLSGRGKTVIGVGEGTGERKVEEALEKALHSPILERNNIRGAKSILLHIGLGPDTDVKTLFSIVEAVIEEAKENFPEVEPNLKMGYFQSEDMEGRIRITVIATDFEEEEVGKTMGEEEVAKNMNATAAPMGTSSAASLPEEQGWDTPYGSSTKGRTNRRNTRVKIPRSITGKDYLFGGEEEDEKEI